ncbi:MAG TPA: hypothetical protein VFI34_10780 [Candidatus Limnocylindrales bacterium]|nr:hypothetical protein [Candidatus Limnocylindrales bacterium]
MTTSDRPTLRDRIRNVFSTMGQSVAASPRARLTPAHATVRPARVAARTSWLLLAEGRPTLLVRHRR